MVIEGSFYKITPINEYSQFFDLELLHEIGGKNPRKEFKHVAYGISLERAIKIITMYNVNQRHKQDVINLEQFLNSYKEEINQIKQVLKRIM